MASFRVGTLHRSGESFLRSVPAAHEAMRLIVALFVSAVFGVLGQNLSSGVINLVIDCRQLGVVSYKYACQLLRFRIGGCGL